MQAQLAVAPVQATGYAPTGRAERPAPSVTWYGGLLAGTLSVWLDARRHRLSVGRLAGATAVPLSVAHGVGRLGCLLAGDGTYGTPSDLPWALSFPRGVVPVMVPVHPTPLYEALGAFAIAVVLAVLRRRLHPAALFGAYAALSGVARAAVETLRINDPVLLGLTQPQLWSLLLIAIGVVLLVRYPTAPGLSSHCAAPRRRRLVRAARGHRRGSGPDRPGSSEHSQLVMQRVDRGEGSLRQLN